MPATVRQIASNDLSDAQSEQIRALLWAAFNHNVHGFTEDDWQHALGNVHFLLELESEIIGHASVVERTLHVDALPVRTGYVEAVAIAPSHQARGHGTALMRAVDEYIDANYELGGLGTGKQGFYERLGWQIWNGPTSVRTSTGEHRTPEEDGYIMVRPTSTSPPLDTSLRISCEWRPGDVW